MSISFACPCGKLLKVADQYAGKRAKCPACATPVQVPMPEPEPPADADSAAFDLLNDNSEPVPRTTSAQRTWDAPADPRPYAMTSEPSTSTKTKSVSDLPKFRAKKIKRKEERERERTRISISPAVIMSGLGVLVFGGLTAVLFANNRFSIWILVLLGGSVLNLIRGLLGLSEE